MAVLSVAHFFGRMRKIILTKNTELSFELPDDLTCRIPLECYFSAVAVSFFPNLQFYRNYQSIYQKGPFVSTEYFITMGAGPAGPGLAI